MCVQNGRWLLRRARFYPLSMRRTVCPKTAFTLTIVEWRVVISVIAIPEGLATTSGQAQRESRPRVECSESSEAMVWRRSNSTF